MIQSPNQKENNLHLKSSFASLGGRRSSKGIVRIFRLFLVFSKKTHLKELNTNYEKYNKNKFKNKEIKIKC